MEHRELGRTGWRISGIGFGAWAIGGDAWGRTDDAESLRAIHRAIDLGANFIDTADVYGDGHSERLIAQALRDRGNEVVVATKAGRRLDPHVAGRYNRRNLTAFVERSLRNLGVEALDLLQRHCPPSGVYHMPQVFGILDDLVQAGKVRYYGVSVERVDEGLRAIEYPNVQSVQIIFNMFRLKPAEELFRAAAGREPGATRAPLDSDVPRGDRHDPRGQEGAAGRGQRARRRAAPIIRGGHGARPRGVRPPLPRDNPRSLVEGGGPP